MLRNNKNIIVISISIAAVIIIALVLRFMLVPTQQVEEKIEENYDIENSYISSTSSVDDCKFASLPYREVGYANLKEYWDDLLVKRSEANGISEQAISSYGSIITDEQKQKLIDFENKMVNASSIEKYNKYFDGFNAVIAECDRVVAVLTTEQIEYSGAGADYYYSDGSGLTKSGGVNWHNGRKETWYSSRVLWHYRTDEWTLGTDGVYRDSDGYVIVAASDLNQGSIVDTSLGAGKVYDSGCAPGTTDIYCAW